LGKRTKGGVEGHQPIAQAASTTSVGGWVPWFAQRRKIERKGRHAPLSQTGAKRYLGIGPEAKNKPFDAAVSAKDRD